MALRFGPQSALADSQHIRRSGPTFDRVEVTLARVVAKTGPFRDARWGRL